MTSEEAKKKMCSGDDCFTMIETDDYILRKDGTPYPPSTLCWDCRTPEIKKRIKAYRKKMNRFFREKSL